MERCSLSILVLACMAVSLTSGQVVQGPPPAYHPEVLTNQNVPPPAPKPRGDRKDVPDNFRRSPPPKTFTLLGQVGASPPTIIKTGPPPPRRSKDVPDNFRRRPTMTKAGPPPMRRFGAPPPPGGYMPPLGGYVPPPRFVPTRPPVYATFFPPIFPDLFFPPHPTHYPTEPPRFYEVKKEEEEESKS